MPRKILEESPPKCIQQKSPTQFCRGASPTFLKNNLQRTPKGGGSPGGGGGQNLTRRPPHGKQFPTPLTSVRFAPPYLLSLIKSFRHPQNFPQVTSSETVFGGSPKWFSRGHPREVSLFALPPLYMSKVDPIWCFSVFAC